MGDDEDDYTWASSWAADPAYRFKDPHAVSREEYRQMVMGALPKLPEPSFFRRGCFDLREAVKNVPRFLRDWSITKMQMHGRGGVRDLRYVIEAELHGKDGMVRNFSEELWLRFDPPWLGSECEVCGTQATLSQLSSRPPTCSVDCDRWVQFIEQAWIKEQEKQGLLIDDYDREFLKQSFGLAERPRV